MPELDKNFCGSEKNFAIEDDMGIRQDTFSNLN
jgi:hypothetical protein